MAELDEKDILEHDTQTKCLKALEVLDIYAWRNNTGALKVGKRFLKFGKKYSSDIIGMCPGGRIFCCETKRPVGGKKGDGQKEFIYTIRKGGGVAFFAETVEVMFANLVIYGVVDESKIKQLIKEGF